MFKILFSVLTFIFLAKIAIGQNNYEVIKLPGTYKNCNVFVQNPFDREENRYAVKKIMVNDVDATAQFYSSAFELELMGYGFEKGDSVYIEMLVEGDEEPKAYLSTSLLPFTAADFSDVVLENDSLLSWSLEYATVDGEFIVQQWMWNRWVELGTIDTKGTFVKQFYHFTVSFHEGENKFRVLYDQGRIGLGFSNEVVSVSDLPQAKLMDFEGERFTFNTRTRYEIYDAYGNVVRKGLSTSPDLTALGRGVYYVNYGTTVGDIWQKSKK